MLLLYTHLCILLDRVRIIQPILFTLGTVLKLTVDAAQNGKFITL